MAKFYCESLPRLTFTLGQTSGYSDSPKNDRIDPFQWPMALINDGRFFGEKYIRIYGHKLQSAHRDFGMPLEAVKGQENMTIAVTDYFQSIGPLGRCFL